MNKFLPVTVPVQVINIPGDFSSPASTTIDPNPVVARTEAGGAAAKTGSQATAQAETAGGRAPAVPVPELRLPRPLTRVRRT